MAAEASSLAVLPGAAGDIRLVRASMPPSPGAGEVRVRMLRAPINPADLLAIDGRYSFELPLDLPLGAEGVGVIEAVGDGVADLAPGDRALMLSRGNWCGYRTLPRPEVVALSHGIGIDQAAMLRINPSTAMLLLEVAGVKSGDVLVQNAAGSAVAAWVRALAARMGVTVVDVVRRPDSELPKAIVDGEGLSDRVNAAAGGRPIRTALDCVAGAATGRMAACLAPGGRLVVFGHLSGEPISVRSQLLTGGGLSIHGFSLRPAEAAMGHDGVHAMFDALLAFHAHGPLALPVREVVPLSQAEEAVALARAGGKGRVLLDLTA